MSRALIYLNTLIIDAVVSAGMAIRTLELRNVTEIKRMAEWTVTFMAGGTLPGILVTELDRMTEGAIDRGRLAAKRLIESRVANIAVVSDSAAIA